MTTLREAAQALYDEVAETFPDEWIDDESSMAMSVTARGRTLYDLRTALASPDGLDAATIHIAWQAGYGAALSDRRPDDPDKA